MVIGEETLHLSTGRVLELGIAGGALPGFFILLCPLAVVVLLNCLLGDPLDLFLRSKPGLPLLEAELVLLDILVEAVLVTG